jgi:RNA-binding protein
MIDDDFLLYLSFDVSCNCERIMNELNPKDKRFLKAKAHALKPLIQVGKQGVTKAFAQQISELLGTHELIKVKFNEFKDERKELFKALAKDVQAYPVSIVGNTGILFRQNVDPKKQKYQLPSVS